MKKFVTLFAATAAIAVCSAATPVVSRPLGAKMNRQEVKSQKAPLKADHQWPSGSYTSLGTGSMTDDMLTGMYGYLPVTYDVEILQSDENPNVYRVVAPYGQNFADAMQRVNHVTLSSSQYDAAGVKVLDIDVTDPEDVYFAKTMTGCDWGSGEMYIGIPSSAKVWFRDGVFGAPMRGVAVGDDDGAVAMNTREKFRILLPSAVGTDYSFEISLHSQCLTSRTVTGTLLTGADIEYVKYNVIPNMQEDEMAGAVADVAAGNTEFNVRGNFEYEMSADARKETLILVGLDSRGLQVASAFISYYFVGDDEEWVDAGTVEFTDGILPNFVKDLEPQTMTCQLQRAAANPRQMRLVNPYATHSLFATGTASHPAGHNHYIYINADNENLIMLEESPLCMAFGKGMFRVSSQARYYLDAGFDEEEVLELELGATIESGIMTFPEEAILVSMMNFDNGDWYMDSVNQTQIVLPANFDLDAVGIESVEADANAETEYYTLQGVRVLRPAAGNLYITRRAGKTAKILFR